MGLAIESHLNSLPGPFQEVTRLNRVRNRSSDDAENLHEGDRVDPMLKVGHKVAVKSHEIQLLCELGIVQTFLKY